MLKLIGAFISFLLIFIIFLRIPKESAGLVSFTTKSNLLGSPNSAERFLNILTSVSILVYILVAVLLNLSSS
uniref:Preprotein translocase SecG subunit n=1 Tax=Nitzschia traheaformis TaxID=1881117 RepID=UPI001EF9E8FD|nr:Preprotein translocase SecG subunit [Nitzschia traheaformis]ULD15809.1 Preprotein translocase SecG subunit [Nitzschia traheaformis]